MNQKQIQPKLKAVILRITSWFETIISIILILSIAALIIHLILTMAHSGASDIGENTLQSLLQYCFGLVIAIEFVRMLSKHSVNSIIEIILFSIARSMIAEHQNPGETVLLIIALLLLMLIRKYLLIPGDAEE